MKVLHWMHLQIRRKRKLQFTILQYGQYMKLLYRKHTNNVTPKETTYNSWYCKRYNLQSWYCKRDNLQFMILQKIQLTIMKMLRRQLTSSHSTKVNWQIKIRLKVQLTNHDTSYKTTCKKEIPLKRQLTNERQLIIH